MKIRNGFVSNSSSSSFVVSLSSLGFNKLRISVDFDLGSPESDEYFDNLEKRFNLESEEYAKIMQTEIDKLNKDNTGWNMEIYQHYLIATTLLDNFDLIEYLDDKYGIKNQNLTKFGSYSGFNHDLKTLRNFVNQFLYDNTESC